MIVVHLFIKEVKTRSLKLFNVYFFMLQFIFIFFIFQAIIAWVYRGGGAVSFIRR